MPAPALTQASLKAPPPSITQSLTLNKGDWLTPSKGNEPAIKIRGNNLVVDFAGATLRGTPATTEPDARTGVGIDIQGNNITIKNLKIHGYKIALIARNSSGIKILNSDFSYNWKQRLLSTPEREDLSDWMSFHNNENGEWLRFGAAIYLDGCDQFEVKGNRAVGGQCGLMLNRSNRGLAWNNNFSFLSAIGVGFYRSSDNRLMHNKIDWCVRGFSYGVYNRGQDSAGILIFEQCDRNVIAYNSVTHGGDGFFLWAGQTTMDTGKGGCNDNLLYGNDFSHAPTNGIEATFSRNTFANNLLMECWHGIWGGYSYETKILGNLFAYNTDAIAIEHGQDNTITGNTFFRDATGIRLWSNPSQDPNWGYPKNRDTRSRGYKIHGNNFQHITQGSSDPNPSVIVDRGAALNMRASEDVVFGPNTFGPIGRLVDLQGPLTNVEILPATADAQKRTEATPEGTTTTTESTVSSSAMSIRDWKKGTSGSWGGLSDGILQPISSLFAPKAKVSEGDRSPGRYASDWNPLKNRAGSQNSVGQRPEGARLHAVTKEAVSLAPNPLNGGIDPFLKPGSRRGWESIIVDEWGPYDFQRPILRPVHGQEGRYQVLGPDGTWRVVRAKGASVSAKSGKIGERTPSFVDIRAEAAGQVEVVLEYVGKSTTDHRGIVTPAGKPVRFGFSRFEAPLNWNVSFHRWSKSVNPADVHANPDEAALKEAFATPPLKVWTGKKLDFAGASFLPGLPNDHVALKAETLIEGLKGDFEMILTTDDGARVWIDEYLLIGEAWKYQGPTVYRKRVHLTGRNRLRLEHFQIDGYAALKLELRPINP